MAPFDTISFSFIKKLFKKLSEHREKIPIDHPDNSITDEKIANVSRSKITDLWTSPFWSKIPDKPFSTLGSEFKVTNGRLEIASISRSKISDFFASPFWNNIPDKPSQYPPEPHTHTRSEITDFWNSPFWENIPDKPSQYPPEPHTHTRSEITDFFSTPFWSKIPDKPFEGLGSEFSVDANKNLVVNQIDFTKITNRKISLIDVDSDFKPNTDNAYDLGKDNLRWKNIFGYRLNIKSPGTTIGANPDNASNGWLVLTDGTNCLGIDNNEIASTLDLYLEASHQIILISKDNIVRPHSDNTINFGTKNFRWHNIYLGGILAILGGKIGIGTDTPEYHIHIIDDSNPVELRLTSKLSTTITLEADTDNVTETDQPKIQFIQDGGIVQAVIGYDAGENAFRIMQKYSDALKFGTNNTIRAMFTSDGHFIPASNNAYDLGDENHKWRNAYIAGVADIGSLKIGGTEVIDSSRNIKNVNTINAIEVYASSLVRVGDLEFRNGWRIVEDPKHGLVLVSPSGKKYRFKLEEVVE